MAGPPEFFIDRSVGRKHLAAALRQQGVVVHTMASVYAEKVVPGLADERRPSDAGREGWIVLMKDDATVAAPPSATRCRRRRSARSAIEDVLD